VEVAETPAEQESALDRLMAAKGWTDPSQIAEAYEYLESRAGRQGQELGDLRKLVEDKFESLEQQQQRPQVSDWDSLIDDNPARAYQVALQNGDQYHAQAARQAWDDLAPGSPDMYDANRFMYGKISELENRLTETTQPIQQQARENELAAAYQTARDKYTDWDAREQAMKQAVEASPFTRSLIVNALESGDYDQKVEALDTLYKLTAGPVDPANLRAAAKDIARVQAEENQRAKEAAMVASGTAAVDPPRLSEADQIAAEWDKLDAPWKSGWLEPS
jgi:hypothetical protein